MCYGQYDAGRRTKEHVTMAVLAYGNCVKACPFDAIHIVDGSCSRWIRKNVKHVENVLQPVQSI